VVSVTAPANAVSRFAMPFFGRPGGSSAIRTLARNGLRGDHAHACPKATSGQSSGKQAFDPGDRFLNATPSGRIWPTEPSKCQQRAFLDNLTAVLNFRWRHVGST
jgi:hypothetical protein